MQMQMQMENSTLTVALCVALNILAELALILLAFGY